MYNEKEAPKTHTSGKLYRSLFVRHWDTYFRPQRQAIWFAALVGCAEPPPAESGERSWLTLSNLVNALKRTGLESPVPPDGGVDNFDIGKKGLVFVAKDPDLNPALHTKHNIYVVPLENFLETTPIIYTVDMGDIKGAMTSPSFSADGTMVAFLAMKEDGYESDMRRLFVMPDIHRPSWILQLLASPNGETRWDQNPGSVKWSADGISIYLSAEDQGREMLFTLPSDSTDTDSLPQPLTFEHSVSAFRPLCNGDIFVSKSSLIDPSIYHLIRPLGFDHPPSYSVQTISSLSQNGEKLALNPSQITSIHFQGSPATPTPGSLIHALVVKPSHFDPSKRYPVALLIHGGPQGAWTNSWSTRWNPAVFAEQGYVVVCPNITGSTGYGQALTNAIQRQWGGRPYEDLEKCLAHLDAIPWADTDRAVALGASYGGYMVNWLQGRALGRRLRALVCHDGVFSTRFELATDELYFVNHDFGGPWRPGDAAARADWDRWDPSLHVGAWRTPQLVVHSERDYRLTMADGLAAFNALRARGVESEFLTFEDENHLVLRPENSLRWHGVVLDFINRHVGLPRVRVDPGIVMDPAVDERGSLEREVNREGGSGRMKVLERTV